MAWMIIFILLNYVFTGSNTVVDTLLLVKHSLEENTKAVNKMLKKRTAASKLDETQCRLFGLDIYDDISFLKPVVDVKHSEVRVLVVEFTIEVIKLLKSGTNVMEVKDIQPLSLVLCKKLADLLSDRGITELSVKSEMRYCVTVPEVNCLVAGKVDKVFCYRGDLGVLAFEDKNPNQPLEPLSTRAQAASEVSALHSQFFLATKTYPSFAACILCNGTSWMIIMRLHVHGELCFEQCKIITTIALRDGSYEYDDDAIDKVTCLLLHGVVSLERMVDIVKKRHRSVNDALCTVSTKNPDDDDREVNDRDSQSDEDDEEDDAIEVDTLAESLGEIDVGARRSNRLKSSPSSMEKRRNRHLPQRDRLEDYVRSNNLEIKLIHQYY